MTAGCVGLLFLCVLLVFAKSGIWILHRTTAYLGNFIDRGLSIHALFPHILGLASVVGSLLSM